jgi:hypothetical protein
VDRQFDNSFPTARRSKPVLWFSASQAAALLPATNFRDRKRAILDLRRLTVTDIETLEKIAASLNHGQTFTSVPFVPDSFCEENL